MAVTADEATRRLTAGFSQPIAEAAGTNSQMRAFGMTPEAQPLGTPQGMPAQSSGGSIDAFMAAIRQQESGGNYQILGPQTRYGRPRGAYQILDSNWDAWAAEAGLAGADWHDQQAQDHVARFKFLQYYQQFGSWEAVAVAWFAGPGRADDYVRDPNSVANLSDVLGTSVARYVQMAMNGMGQSNNPVQSAPQGENGRLDTSQLVAVDDAGHLLAPDAAGAWQQMVADAARDGVTITVGNSYRDYDTQVALAAEKGLYSQGGLAAEPGTSRHGLGTAVDINNTAEAVAWLRRNAAQYGFATIPREPWHWQYEGGGTTTIAHPSSLPQQDATRAPKRGASALVSAFSQLMQQHQQSADEARQAGLR